MKISRMLSHGVILMAAVVLTTSTVPRIRPERNYVSLMCCKLTSRCLCKAFAPSSRNLDHEPYPRDESYPRDDSWREVFSRLMMAIFQGTTPVSEPIDQCLE